MQTDFRLILALWGAGLGAAAQYSKISVIFDRLGTIYPDAGAALGFVVSVVGFVGIVFGVISGLVVARIRYRRALLLALWVGAGLSLIQATLPPLPVMLATRVLEGVSHLAIVVATPTLIAQLSAERHRPLTLTLWGTFFGVAYTILVVLGLPLVAAYGVPSLFLAHALWMAGFALILGRCLRALDSAAPTDTLSLRRIANDHIAIYRSPAIAAPAAGWLFYTFCFLGLLTVLPPFIAPEHRAPVLGAMPMVSILVSMTLGVYLMRHISAVRVVVIGFGLGVLALGWLAMVPGGPVACLVLSAALGLIQGASFAAVAQLNRSAEDQAKANGALAQMGNLGNTLGTPGLLAVLGLAGYVGMIGASMAVFAAGLAVHLWLAARRRAAPI